MQGMTNEQKGSFLVRPSPLLHCMRGTIPGSSLKAHPPNEDPKKSAQQEDGNSRLWLLVRKNSSQTRAFPGTSVYTVLVVDTLQ